MRVAVRARRRWRVVGDDARVHVARHRRQRDLGLVRVLHRGRLRLEYWYNLRFLINKVSNSVVRAALGRFATEEGVVVENCGRVRVESEGRWNCL